MKKALIALMMCLFSIGTFAQVTVQKQEKRFDYPIQGCYNFVHDLKSDSYSVVIGSDNEFESTAVHLDLGKGKKALASMDAILGLFNEEGDYKISGYECHAYPRYLLFFNIGKLEFAAGDYRITKSELVKYKEWLDSNINE